MVDGQQFNPNILLVGAGQLGSRHLQALAKLNYKANVYVVDLSNENLQIAAKRFQEIDGYDNHEVYYHNQLEELSLTHLNVGIVATNASVRATIVQNILEYFNIDYLILEKFLFQKIADYEIIHELLNRNNTQCYVNCPRRLFKNYQKIKGAIDSSRPVQMEVVGNNWGLGCNGIHFVDLFQFLTGRFIENWHNLLEDGYLNGKREGFVEFSGAITGYSDWGDQISLRCYDSGQPNLSVRISSTGYRWLITEGLGQLLKETITENDWGIKKDTFEMPFQSNLTNLVVADLIKTGVCSLTPFKDSSRLHQPFLKTLINHYSEAIGERTEVCPVT